MFVQFSKIVDRIQEKGTEPELGPWGDLNNIINHPSPHCITDIKSWNYFGNVRATFISSSGFQGQVRAWGNSLLGIQLNQSKKTMGSSMSWHTQHNIRSRWCSTRGKERDRWIFQKLVSTPGFHALYPMFFCSPGKMTDYDSMQTFILLKFLVQRTCRPVLGLCLVVPTGQGLGIELNRCHCNVWGRDKEFWTIGSSWTQ